MRAGKRKRWHGFGGERRDKHRESRGPPGRHPGSWLLTPPPLCLTWSGFGAPPHLGWKPHRHAAAGYILALPLRYLSFVQGSGVPLFRASLPGICALWAIDCHSPPRDHGLLRFGRGTRRDAPRGLTSEFRLRCVVLRVAGHEWEGFSGGSGRPGARPGCGCLLHQLETGVSLGDEVVMCQHCGAFQDFWPSCEARCDRRGLTNTVDERGLTERGCW